MFISPDVSGTLIKPIANPLVLPSIRRSDTEGIPKDLHSTPCSLLCKRPVDATRRPLNTKPLDTSRSTHIRRAIIVSPQV